MMGRISEIDLTMRMRLLKSKSKVAIHLTRRLIAEQYLGLPYEVLI